MGRLVKNHLARLIVLTAATYQLAGGVHGYFWPKVFFDYWAGKSLNVLVTPMPILQSINVFFGLLLLLLDYPLPFFIPGTSIHRSIVVRLVLIPIAALAALFLYQGTNAAIYYMIGWGIYFWGHTEREEICMPWKVKIPSKGGRGGRV